MNWKFTDQTNQIVYRVRDDGGVESCDVSAISDWTASGNAPLPADEPNLNDAILAQINGIEQATMVPRLVREGLIVMAEDLAEREAAKLTADGTPKTKEELLAANIGYQKTKAVDDQIRALRSQLK